jgi:hypothetical protein
MDAHPVKVCADATLVFPLIVSQTFFKEYQRRLLAEEGNQLQETVGPVNGSTSEGLKQDGVATNGHHGSNGHSTVTGKSVPADVTNGVHETKAVV